MGIFFSKRIVRSEQKDRLTHARNFPTVVVRHALSENVVSVFFQQRHNYYRLREHVTHLSRQKTIVFWVLFPFPFMRQNDFPIHFVRLNI